MAAAVEIIKSIKEEIKLATESLPAVRYNSRMLQFLCQQLGKVKDALLNPAMSMTEKALGDLKDAVEQGSHLVRRHAEVFKVENFYKIKDVRHMVQMTCEKLATCFDHLRMQQQVDVQVSMSEDIVQDDRNYMYWYLTCILEGKRVDRQLPDRLKMELEMQISDHRCYMKYVNWIEERKLEKRGRIGAGGEGDIEMALWNGHTVAVKTHRKDLSPEARAEFITEVEIHTRMNHPNVVRCWGATPSNAIVMELAEFDLERLLEKQGPAQPWQWKVGTMKSASAGLRYLHDNRVVHRDVKCSNFLVFNVDRASGPIIKIGDFGLALAKTETRSKTARPLMGTLLWMAPEIHDGQPHSFRSDVFSFGLVLYMIASGCQPYGGISHHEQLLKGKKKKKGHGPCLLPNDCPKRLADLLGECISVDSRERPTMAKVDSNLQKILEECQRTPATTSTSEDVEMEEAPTRSDCSY
ncbi:unnamed protein product [Ostreobium quekettii]|uniref:Protein kinase domain-containing protein n=1 Tax=Ostreobium quekettii TaxID=121088 RepID=A0A8S1J5T2_9CHLO|nr:unnamed protein product [Ostreobium quekettii]